MEQTVKIILIILAFNCMACGGGGSEGSKFPNYAGAWSGGVSLISNTCTRQIPDEFKYISTLHDVQQADSEDAAGVISLDIVLNDGIDTYVGLGEVRSDGTGNSFSVTGSEHELPGFLSGNVCIETIDFAYQSIDFSNSLAGFVERHSSIECTKGSSVQTCDVTYTGTAYRYANPSAVPTPTPNE